MIEKSKVVLNNYDKLQFLDEESKLFLEKINVTNLLDRLTFSQEELHDLIATESDYQQLDPKNLQRVFRNRGK